MVGFRFAVSATVRATASVAAMFMYGNCFAVGVRMTEKDRFSPRGDTQGRLKRPLPAVCSSAMTTVPSGVPSAASRRASSIVEPIRS